MDCFPIILLRSLLRKWIDPFLFFKEDTSSTWRAQNRKLSTENTGKRSSSLTDFCYKDTRDAESTHSTQSSQGTESIIELPTITPGTTFRSLQPRSPDPTELHFYQMSGPIMESAPQNRIERLPTKLIDRIIEATLFSESLGSHDALHTLQVFCQEEKDSIFERRIHAVLESDSIRKRIETSWNLCPTYDHTKTCRHTIDKTAPHDLASKSIVNCTQCFFFLLDHQTIRASSFCQDGQSFYLIADKSTKLSVTERILSLIDVEDFFKPAAVNRGNSGYKSILQLTTSNAQLFRSCWERLQFLPAITTLGLMEIRNICRFADIDLANDLLHRGVDLGTLDRGNEYTNWHALLSQQNPEPMLYWFQSRGLEPPEDLLTYAATYNCVDASRWILHHSISYGDWRGAALVAADKQEPEGVGIFEMIIQHAPPEHRADRALPQDLLITIVDMACSCSCLFDLRLAGKPCLQTARACLEEVAVRKIQAVRGLDSTRVAEVIGIKVKARQAGLDLIIEALEAFD